MDDFPEPTDEDLDVAEKLLRLLDRAFMAASPPFGPEDWNSQAEIAEEVPDLETARPGGDVDTAGPPT
jgi:hypothetical protein